MVRIGACLQTVGHLLEVVNRLEVAIIIINAERKIRLFNEKAAMLYKLRG